MEAVGSGAPAAGVPLESTTPAPPRQARRGPAPIASFDHDGSDESSPDSKQTFRLPEIREHPAAAAGGGGTWLAAPGEGRARSHSTPAAGALGAPPAPRIDISRASSSSHHDSRDSSPEMALFAGDAAEGSRQRLELGFREDGALDLRSSTEELSFLEATPAEGRAATAPPVAPPAPPPERHHSRKDSQCSEAALLAVSGRTSRLSSVGSACSAVSHVSHVSRLSVVSGVSRSPSPHRMLLETSFCGPKPIETDPEACAAALAGRIIADLSGDAAPPSPVPAPALALALDARDHREVRTEVTVEAARPMPPTQAVPVRPAPTPVPAPVPVVAAAVTPEQEKTQKERENVARTSERTARPRVRRQPSEPEVYKSKNKSKDIIRIKLRPDDEEEEEERAPALGDAARKPASLALGGAPVLAPAPPSPVPSRRRSPSPLGPPSVSRKSSFCSLFKSRETIGSPDSPQAQEALRRKRSLTEGRARSKSRDRSATPTSSKIRGSVLSLFRTPRRSTASSTPGSRATSPAPSHYPSAPPDPKRADKLKYYEQAKNGVIHIPLRTPPEERGGGVGGEHVGAGEAPRPTSAPHPREPVSAPASLTAAVPRAACSVPSRAPPPVLRTVLPDGSIIIPLHSPTERAIPEPPRPASTAIPAVPAPHPSNPDDTEIKGGRGEPAAISCEAAPVPAVTSPPHELHPAGPAPEPLNSPPDATRPEDTRKRRKERLVFTTHVGSREQVFSTQFSITKTPSVTSEISGSFPSFDNGAGELRDTHIAAAVPPPAAVGAGAGAGGSGALTPRDSSESEPSSEAAPPPAGNDVERRGLVVQESFEEELPYVPTTLPQERSVAMPMIPVRDRGGVLVRGVQRPRAAPAPVTVPSGRHTPAPAPVAPPPAATPTDKLRIKLPRRPRLSSASKPPATRERTRSGGGSGDSGGENRVKQEWIDFEEVPERRKQPKRIQTLPVGGGAGGADADEGAGSGVVFSYVEPEQCRCECHAHAAAATATAGHDQEDQLPLLDEMHNSRISTSSAECGSGPALTAALDADSGGEPSEELGRP